MIRGISGGQKKRVTTGEMIAGPKRTLFMVSRNLSSLSGRSTTNKSSLGKSSFHETHSLNCISTILLDIISSLAFKVKLLSVNLWNQKLRATKAMFAWAL